MREFTSVILRKAKKWGGRAGELDCHEVALLVGRLLVRPTHVHSYLEIFTRTFDPGNQGPLEKELTDLDR